MVHIAIDPELISVDHAQAGSKPESHSASKQILCIKEQIHSTTLNVQPKSSQNYTYIDFLIHRRSGTQLVGW